MFSNLTIESLPFVSALPIIFAALLMGCSGWLIGAHLVVDDGLRVSKARTRTITIWLAGNLSAEQSGLPRRVKSALDRELNALPHRLPVRTKRLRRQFPIDAAAWARLLETAPENVSQIVPADKHGVIIWAEGKSNSPTARLHFLGSRALSDNWQPGTIGLMTLDDVPLELRTGLPPVLASLALAHLTPNLEEAGISRDQSFAILTKKLALHIGELTSQCTAELGSAVSYLYAWMRFQLALEVDGGEGLGARFDELKCEIDRRGGEQQRLQRAQIWSNLARFCFDWGVRADALEPFERSLTAADNAIALFSDGNASNRQAVLRHLKARAFMILSEKRKDPALLHRAMTALRDAAHGCRHDRNARQWAMIRHHMGEVYTELARYRAGTTDLERAVGAFTDALLARGGEESVAQAETRHALGVALMELGMREGKPAHFERAVGALSTAHDTLNAAGAFASANRVSINLSIALTAFGRLKKDAGSLKMAVEGLRFLSVDAARQPDEISEPKLLLGRALRILGSTQGAVQSLQAATARFQAISGSVKHVACAHLRAAADFERGLALTATAGLSGDVKDYADAVAAFRDALHGLNRTAEPRRWAMAQLHLARAAAKAAGSNFGGGNGLAGDAASAYREALSIFKRSEMPHFWARLQDELGTALQLSALENGGGPELENAVQAWRKALDGKFVSEPAPRDRTMILNDLGNALADLAQSEGDASRLREALSTYLEAYDLALASGQDDLAEIVDANLNRTESALAAKPCYI